MPKIVIDLENDDWEVQDTKDLRPSHAVRAMRLTIEAVEYVKEIGNPEMVTGQQLIEDFPDIIKELEELRKIDDEFDDLGGGI